MFNNWRSHPQGWRSVPVAVWDAIAPPINWEAWGINPTPDYREELLPVQLEQQESRTLPER